MIAPRFFKSPKQFSAWLAKHHATRSELWVGLYKKHAALRGMIYPQAVDEALCWGWIDGILRRVDDDRVMQRFTPRKAKSTWSLMNVAKVKVLLKAGRMRPPGLAAFKAREQHRTGIYAYEAGEVKLPPAESARFKRNATGWGWFQKQPPSYRQVATHWVVSAKRAETRERRLTQVIEHSAQRKTLRQFTPLHLRDR